MSVMKKQLSSGSRGTAAADTHRSPTAPRRRSALSFRELTPKRSERIVACEATPTTGNRHRKPHNTLLYPIPHRPGCFFIFEVFCCVRHIIFQKSPGRLTTRGILPERSQPWSPRKVPLHEAHPHSHLLLRLPETKVVNAFVQSIFCFVASS